MNKKLLFVIILTLAFLVRVLFLVDFPKGFSGDEAQQGYSAYSILKTGKDEWGQFLPVSPRGFGDFKPPLLVYSIVPSVAIFGLNEFAVRLPTALMGVLTVLVIFFLAKELFNEKIAYWSSVLLAINPWHIQISRTAFEGGFGVLAFGAGLLFFLKGLQKQKYFCWSFVFWGLTLYTYHSFRLFLALFLIFILFYFRKNLTFKKLTIPLIIFILFLLPLVFNIRSILIRSSDVGIFSKQQINDYFKNKGTSPLPFVVDRIFDNKFTYLSNSFYENYLSYYSPQFLFSGQRSSGSYLNFPGYPLLYPVETLSFFTGVFWLVKRKVIVLLVWFLLAAIPAATAVGSMSANRAITFLPLISVISAFGLQNIIDHLKTKIKINENSINKGILTILLLSFISFIYFYLIKLPKNPPESLRTEYKQVFKFALDNQSNYNQVVFSKIFSQPQIFLAFYGKIDPVIFQQSSQDWLRYEKSNKLYIDQLESWNLGKFYFEDLNWNNKESKRKNALIISKPLDFPDNIEPIFEVKKREEILYKFVHVGN